MPLADRNLHLTIYAQGNRVIVRGQGQHYGYNDTIIPSQARAAGEALIEAAGTAEKSARTRQVD